MPSVWRRKEIILQKHAMALGYFFLSVFCVFATTQGYLELFCIPLLLVALVAALMGIGFLMSAWAGQFQTAKRWLLQMVQLEQQAPINAN